MNKKNIILTFILGFSIGIIFTILITRIPSVRYDVNNDENGYAGDLKPIDAIEVYYYTPSDVVKNTGYLRAKYRVSPSYTANYFEWQYDNEAVNGQDGYAGVFGKTIDRLQITLSK